VGNTQRDRRAALPRLASDGTLSNDRFLGGEMTEIGPVQLIAVEFGPEAHFEGRIIDELVALEEESTVRLLDLLFVSKDADTGELVALDHQGENLGAIAGALLGFEFEGVARYAPTEGEHAFGMTAAEIQSFGDSLSPGRSAGVLLIEHVWARKLKRAIRDAGGVPVGEGFLTPETVRTVEPELAAMVDAFDREAAASATA
jgi:hypothetical protein